MAAFNIFKKKTPEKAAPAKKVQEKKAEKPVAKKEELKEKKVSPQGKTPAWRILKSPHITEKASDLGELNQYTFEVWKDTNKTEVKKAVGSLYGVDVESVKIVNIPGKERRYKGQLGRASGYKKAIVRIKAGQKIEVLPR
ncbi:MAG: 50S ribosomal protein L23 [Candidatus Nealsonbacteria bacterium]|nr:50S ribosomal protein L23 [Candidatus Nealsonbacteria bacterium]